MATGNIIKLNVGGVVFPTRRSTLTKFEGFFKAMFDSGIPLETDEAGCIFIDRDPKQFSFVLNFMRDGTVDLPNSELEIAQLLREAQYYSLDGLIHLCGGEPSEEWKKANGSPKVRITSDVAEYENFHDVSLKTGEKFAMVIHYNAKMWDDLRYAPIAVNFVEKHSEKWDILFYNDSNSMPACVFYTSPERVPFWPSQQCPGVQTDFTKFFEHLEQLVSEIDRDPYVLFEQHFNI